MLKKVKKNNSIILVVFMLIEKIIYFCLRQLFIKMRFFTYILLFLITSKSLNAQPLKENQSYLQNKDYIKELLELKKTKETAIKENNFDLIATSTNNIADCYTDLGAYYKSIKLLNENLTLLNSKKSKNYKLIAETHLLLANNYDNLFFFDEYLAHTHQYYKNIIKAFPNKEIYKALYYAYLGRYYNIKGQIDKANYYTEGALNIYYKNKKDENLIDVYKLYNAHTFTIRNTHSSYNEKFKYVDTLNIFLNKKFAYNNVKKTRIIVSGAMLNFDLGYNLSMLNDKQGKLHIDKSILIFEKALNSNNKLVGFNYDYSSKINGLKNLLYIATKDYAKALKECNEGIERVSDPDILGLGFSANNYSTITLLRQKHLVLNEINKLNPNIKSQQQIINNLLLMEKIWNRYSQDQINKSEDFSSYMYNENPYSFLFQAYLQLYELTKDKNYLEKIHEYDEKSKYHSLFLTTYLTEKQKKEKESLYNKRQEIYLLYNDYVLSKNNNEKQQKDIKRQLVNLIKSYNKQEENSNLFKQSKIISVKEIQQKLSKNKAVISYINGEIINKNLYAKVITKNELKILKVNNFDSKPWDYLLNLQDSLFHSMNNKNIADFDKFSYKIYKEIFEKVNIELPKHINQLEIIPNAELSNLPFEILVNKQSKINDYRKLDYLLNKYSFSYSLSSSISNLNNLKNSSSVNEMIVFSPSFKDQNLNQLFTTEDKSKEISKLYNTNLLINKNASIGNFKDALNKNSFISVFSHGQSSNDFETNNKGIYFTDGFLTLSDIYKLNSNCDFLILGACETGLGGKEKGEGNINLARAFSSIGVKSMLLASWKIDEESTMTISESFLSYLQNGYSKSEALQKAKLDYLLKANPRFTSPYFWAGLNIIGNDENIKPQQSKFNFWYLSFLIPLLAGFWIYKRKLKS